MAEEPQTQTFKLRYGNEPIDTSVREAGFMESMFRDTIGEIRDMIDATDPGSVQLAGLYYQAAEPLLNDFAADLKAKAGELAEHYKGPSAYQTQLQLRGLHASVVELAGKLGKMGRSLKSYGDTLQWAQANVVEERGRDSRSDNDIDWADQIPFYGIKRSSDRAADHLRAVNERIAQHYEELPVDVQQALPIVVDPEMPDFNTGGLHGPQVGPLGSGSGSGFQNAAFNPGSLPDASYGAGADGSDPSSPGQYPGGYGNGGPNAGGLGNGGLGSGGPGGLGDSDAYGGADPSGLTDTTLGATPPGASSVPSVPSPSASGSPGDYGGTNLAGYDPTASGGPNAPHSPNASTTYSGSGPGMGASPGSSAAGNGGALSAAGNAAAAAGRAGAGGMGMPMIHAPASTRSKDEQQAVEIDTNLYEDDDVWGGPEGATPQTLA